MKERVKNYITVGVLGIFLLAGFLWCVLKPSDATSVAERRNLQQFPALTWDGVMSGEWMEKFDKYTLDQFPSRENFRTLKAWVQFNLLRQRDNNGIYLVGDSVYKLEYPLRPNSVIKAANKLNSINQRLLGNCKVYYAIIPDKNYFTAEQNGYPSLDYTSMMELFDGQIQGMEKIELFDCLSAEDYYSTDTHWRQERLSRVVERLSQKMGFELGTGYTEHSLSPFYGVYYGQAALPLTPDTLTYLENDTIKNAVVYNFETNTTGGVYALDKFSGMDGYDVFLWGASPLLSVENPNATTDKELIIFRDSFGSSLAPLLLDGYKKITLIDIRYIVSDYIDSFVTFDGQDVLFIYSTLILNSGDTLR